MATAGKLHREAVLKHRRSDDPEYGLYVKIYNHHQYRGASQRHESWLQLFGIRRSASEPYMSLYRRVEAACDRIVNSAVDILESFAFKLLVHQEAKWNESNEMEEERRISPTRYADYSFYVLYMGFKYCKWYIRFG